MPSNFSARLRLAAAVAALAATTSGCRYFKAEKRVDMQPFAENTVTAIGEMRKIETQPVWIRLRPYFSDPAILETRGVAKPLLDLVRGVNAYSLQIVSLNESRISDPTKSRELAKFLRGASQQALLNEADEAEIKLTMERRDAVLKNIETKERFMDALQAAEPIVNAVLARGLDLSDQVDAAIMKSVNVIEAKVQAEYKPMLQNRIALLQQQERTMQATAWAEAIGYGDAAAVEDLDLTPAQLHIVMWLGNDGALTMGELARRVAMTEKTITGVVDRLERDALVRRERDPVDRRVVHVRMARRGGALYRRIDAGIASKLAGFLALLDAEDRRNLVRMVEKLTAKLAAEET